MVLRLEVLDFFDPTGQNVVGRVFVTAAVGLVAVLTVTEALPTQPAGLVIVTW